MVTLEMERTAHARLQVVLDTLLRRDFPTSHGIYMVVWALIDQ